jgi:hypothetical protein
MKFFKHYGVICALLFMLIVLPGCDIFEDLFPADKANVNGTWKGATGAIRVEGIPLPLRLPLLAFDGVLDIASVPLTLNLTQDSDDQVRGTVTANFVIGFKMAVDGFVSDDQVALEGTKQFFDGTPTYLIQLQAVVFEGRMDGTWFVFSGREVVKTGTWFAKKT